MSSSHYYCVRCLKTTGSDKQLNCKCACATDGNHTFEPICMLQLILINNDFVNIYYMCDLNATALMLRVSMDIRQFFHNFKGEQQPLLRTKQRKHDYSSTNCIVK